MPPVETVSVAEEAPPVNISPTNSRSLAEMLLLDPETREQLYPTRFPFPRHEDGAVILELRNREGTRQWRHVIRTEEI